MSHLLTVFKLPFSDSVKALADLLKKLRKVREVRLTPLQDTAQTQHTPRRNFHRDSVIPDSWSVTAPPLCALATLCLLPTRDCDPLAISTVLFKIHTCCFLWISKSLKKVTLCLKQPKGWPLKLPHCLQWSWRQGHWWPHACLSCDISVDYSRGRISFRVAETTNSLYSVHWLCASLVMKER